jgi:hypothetical protein
MFEKLRESIRDAMSRASSPAEGRAVLAMMRDAIVEAKVGVSQIRAALDATRAQLEHERHELETVRRRGRLAADIADQETVRVAAQFEQRHLARIDVLERKLAAQESELALAEREVKEMSSQFRAMASGAAPTAAAMPPELDAEPDLEALERAAARAARESAAERQLEELKRRMGR